MTINGELAGYSFKMSQHTNHHVLAGTNTHGGFYPGLTVQSLEREEAKSFFFFLYWYTDYGDVDLITILPASVLCIALVLPWCLASGDGLCRSTQEKGEAVVVHSLKMILVGREFERTEETVRWCKLWLWSTELWGQAFWCSWCSGDKDISVLWEFFNCRLAWKIGYTLQNLHMFNLTECVSGFLQVYGVSFTCSNSCAYRAVLFVHLYCDKEQGWVLD